MNSFIPPHIWEELLRSPNPDILQYARLQLQQDIAFRAFRQPRPPAFTGGPGVLSRLIYDVQHDTRLPGTLVRSEGQPNGNDQQVNEAYDALGGTWSLFWDVYGRDSIDNQGMGLIGCVHYGQAYENAFWDGYRMVFGDGGYIFNPFTTCPDIISHELAHGVTQMTGGYEYQGQSGALNEHISDVFGVLLNQRIKNQTADQADWLIGGGLWKPQWTGCYAIRNMKAPGTAYNNPSVGKDPQPAHMRDYVNTTGDSGGVHINSGIPNKAFYLVATKLGGYAWERAGRLWYKALTTHPRAPRMTFAEFAATTYIDALPGEERDAVWEAWRDVGIDLPPPPTDPAPEPGPGCAGLLIRIIGAKR